MHHVIFIPGLGDGNSISHILRFFWKKPGIETRMFFFGWRASRDTLKEKQQILLRIVRKLYASGEKVSLVGTSAGGSVAVNAFLEEPESIHKVVNVCGRLFVRENVKPTLEKAGRKYPVFISSVENCDSRLRAATPEQLRNIITFRAKVYDGAVPLETIFVEGATNVQLPVPLHAIAIPFALIRRRDQILDFLEVQ